MERLPLTDFTKENYSRTRDADIEYRYTHTRGGGTNWERSIDIHTLSYVKQIATGKLLYSTGSSVMLDAGCWMLCDDPEVGDGEGGVGGRLKREGLYVHI